jgi:hypothetical protein
MERAGGRAIALGARGIVLAALVTCAASCSLLSIKTPEKPLSTRDLNTRILTHEFSARFNVAVEQTADAIATDTDDPVVRANALRWKIAASSASNRAASQMAPRMGLLDMWALTAQMHDYFAQGSGKALFGRQQTRAVTLAANLAREAEDGARALAPPPEFDADQRFVADYVRANPIESLKFARASIVIAWARNNGADAKLVDSLGTVPEAMAGASDVLRMYGDTVPSQTLWRAELSAQEFGISGKDVEAAFKRLDDRLARLSLMADATPQLVHEVVGDVRKQLEASWAEMMGTIHSERVELSTAISAERQAAMQAVDAERSAVTADAARMADQIIADAGKEARHLVREALIFAILFAVVVLGLPFAAGFFVGRAQRRP